MKTNSNKTTLSLRLIVVALFFSAFTSAFGQEQIRSAIDFLICDTSIIRVYKNDSVLVHNHTNYTSSFMLVTPLNPLDNMYIEPIYVNDFEIWGKMVFFCGYKLEGERRKAVFGSFKLTSFPCDTIGYEVLDTCTELKKLDIFRFEYNSGLYETHFVMTGTTGTRSDVIVDYSTSLDFPYIFRVYFSNDETESFDDVAVTEKNVIVSSRKMMNGIPIVAFRKYLRPTVSGLSIFSSAYYSMNVSSPTASTPVYLEYKEDNVFAAVYRVLGYSRIAMLQIDASSSSVNSVEIFSDEAQTVHPTEIKYNKKSDVFDILARQETIREEDSYFLPPMQIYHLTPAVINNQTSYGNGTRFTYNDTYYRLWSIDPLRASSYFVSSGNGVSLPKFFRYKHDEWETCPERFVFFFETGKPYMNEVPEETPAYNLYNLPYYKHGTYKREIPFPIECGHK